jgi:DNA-directed RNA polymerase subunit RPC12/RpoP
MTNANVEFGKGCPQCGWRAGIRIGGTPGVCSQCGASLAPVEGAETLMNYYCRHCKSWFGASPSFTPITTCPNCHQPLD